MFMVLRKLAPNQDIIVIDLTLLKAFNIEKI